MPEPLPAARRLRRRERRLLRRFQQRVQIGLVGLALLLSAGVVEVMEVPRPLPEAARAPAAAYRPEPAPPSEEPPMLAPIGVPDLPSALSTSILDEEIADPAPPDLLAPAMPAPPRGRTNAIAPPVEASPPAGHEIPPVPQPATGLLLGLGLVWIALARRASARDGRYSTIPSSSTSKVSAAPGGIEGGAPRSP